MAKYQLYGDICRAAIIEVEAASVETLVKLIEGDPIDLDALPHYVVQDEDKFATFDWNGGLFDEDGNEIELPSTDYHGDDQCSTSATSGTSSSRTSRR